MEDTPQRRLTESQLLALLLFKDNNAANRARAEKLLADIPLTEMAHWSPTRLMANAFDPQEANRVAAAFELSRRPQKKKTKKRLNAETAYLVLRDMEGLEQEELHVLLLDLKGCLLGRQMVYRGTPSEITVHLPDIFRLAIRMGAPKIMVAHNHPAGDATPTATDITATIAVIAAGKQVEIEVVDHLIIGRGQYTSFVHEKLCKF